MSELTRLQILFAIIRALHDKKELTYEELLSHEEITSLPLHSFNKEEFVNILNGGNIDRLYKWKDGGRTIAI